MFRKKYDFTGQTKEELKMILKTMDYEIASTKSKRELNELYRKINAINKELRNRKREELDKMGRSK